MLCIMYIAHCSNRFVIRAVCHHFHALLQIYRSAAKASFRGSAIRELVEASTHYRCP